MLSRLQPKLCLKLPQSNYTPRRVYIRIDVQCKGINKIHDELWQSMKSAGAIYASWSAVAACPANGKDKSVDVGCVLVGR
jgi:hypothetical protein